VRVTVKGRDEIARLAATFNASASRIEALMNAHRLLLAHASHELRSPLSRLRMAMERLKQNAGDGAAHAEAARNIGELDMLVGEILLSSRLQSGQAALKIEPVDIVGLLAEECAAHGIEAAAPNSFASIVQGDAGLLRRLFRNLLDNASAHGGPEPPEVKVIPAGSKIRILVCDRGPGVPEGEREKIFEPFYRLQGTQGSGAGLGLALVRQITEQHGGEVLCRERSGGGACFEVVLPKAAN
jgi:signal transduction histidine kinase